MIIYHFKNQKMIIEEQIGRFSLEVGEKLDKDGDLIIEMGVFGEQVTFWINRSKVAKLIEHLQTVLK